MKAGDIVRPQDGSGAMLVNDDGTTRHTCGIEIDKEDWVVVATECFLPCGNILHYRDLNTIIIKSLKDGRIVFTMPGRVNVIPKTETRVIDHVAMMQGFLCRGYSQRVYGDWHDKEGRVASKSIFRHCGKKRDEEITFSKWMLEEVEV